MQAYISYNCFPQMLALRALNSNFADNILFYGHVIKVLNHIFFSKYNINACWAGFPYEGSVNKCCFVNIRKFSFLLMIVPFRG
jgi:hypothetical protein